MNSVNWIGRVFVILFGLALSACSTYERIGRDSSVLSNLPVSLTVQVNDPDWEVDLSFSGELRDFDWGDGSPTDALVSDQTSYRHLYSSAGTYTISFKDNGCTSLSVYGLGVGAEYLFTGVSGLANLNSLLTLSMNANSLGTFNTSDLPASLTKLELPDNGLTAFDATVLPENITSIDLRFNTSLPSTVATQLFAELVSSGKSNGTLSLPSFTFASGSQTCIDRATLRNDRSWRTSGVSGCL